MSAPYTLIGRENSFSLSDFIYEASIRELNWKTLFTSSRSADGTGSPVTVSTFETPSVESARRRAFVAFRLRSRHVICGMASMPSSRLSLHAMMLLSMLARAVAQSAIVIASTPAAFSVHAPAMYLALSAFLGGSSSTAMTFSPLSSLRANTLCSVSCAARAPAPAAPAVFETFTRTFAGAFSPLFISEAFIASAFMCSSVVPQQPPAITTPLSIISAVCSAKYPGSLS